MNITVPPVSTICPLFSLSTESVAEFVGRLLNRTYVFIKTQPGAYLALIGANIAAFEIALAVCRFVNHFFCTDASSRELSEGQDWNFTLLFTTIVGGIVYACCKRLDLPLSIWKVIGVSFATNFIYLCCKKR